MAVVYLSPKNIFIQFSLDVWSVHITIINLILLMHLLNQFQNSTRTGKGVLT